MYSTRDMDYCHVCPNYFWSGGGKLFSRLPLHTILTFARNICADQLASFHTLQIERSDDCAVMAKCACQQCTYVFTLFMCVCVCACMYVCLCVCVYVCVLNICMFVHN